MQSQETLEFKIDEMSESISSIVSKYSLTQGSFANVYNLSADPSSGG